MKKAKKKLEEELGRINMREDVVERYARSMFPGILEINFYELRGNRNMSLVFDSDDNIFRALRNAETAAPIFIVEEDSKTLFADRDVFETIMYMMLVKESTDSWIAKFSKEIEKEREEETEEEVSELQANSTSYQGE